MCRAALLCSPSSAVHHPQQLGAFCCCSMGLKWLLSACLQHTALRFLSAASSCQLTKQEEETQQA